MKVIIDRNNPLTVLDQEGNVLFHWENGYELKRINVVVKNKERGEYITDWK